MLIQDDDVRAKSFDTPVLLRLEKLARQRQRVSLSDPEEHDRKIAGDAVAPQILLTVNIAGKVAGAHARCVGSKRARCKAIEEHGLLITESQVLQGEVHVTECH